MGSSWWDTSHVAEASINLTSAPTKKKRRARQITITSQGNIPATLRIPTTATVFPFRKTQKHPRVFHYLLPYHHLSPKTPDRERISQGTMKVKLTTPTTVTACPTPKKLGYPQISQYLLHYHLLNLKTLAEKAIKQNWTAVQEGILPLETVFLHHLLPF